MQEGNQPLRADVAPLSMFGAMLVAFHTDVLDLHCTRFWKRACMANAGEESPEEREDHAHATDEERCTQTQPVAKQCADECPKWDDAEDQEATAGIDASQQMGGCHGLAQTQLWDAIEWCSQAEKRLPANQESQGQQQGATCQCYEHSPYGGQALAQQNRWSRTQTLHGAADQQGAQQSSDATGAENQPQLKGSQLQFLYSKEDKDCLLNAERARSQP